MQIFPERRSKLYGDLAFAVLVLAAYAQILFVRRLQGEPWELVVTFVCGAAYATLGVLQGEFDCGGSRRAVHAYYLVQCILVAVAVLLTPAQGAFFILMMPLISQSIIDYGWRGATLITGLLYAISIAAFWSYGRTVALQVATGFLPAFLFTLIFTIIIKETAKGKRRAEEMSAQLAGANEQLHLLAAQASELATTRERNRLAREIHDGVGHYLTVIKVQLDAADALMPVDPTRAADSVRTAARLAADALDDVRRSVSALATESIRAPLADLLRQLLGDAAPVPAFQVEGTPRVLGPAAEHALFRAAQEGLTNLRKHSAATTAALTLDFRDPTRVRLTLVDNGRGSSVPAPAPSHENGGGHGLRGLRERIALLGGSVTAGNRPEGGFTLSVEVPA